MRRRQAAVERLLDHAGALVGVDEAVGRGDDAAVLGDRARAHPEQDQRAGREPPSAAISSITARAASASGSRCRSRPSRGCRAGSASARVRELAPDAADQPEAVAADALDARLVVVGRAEPAARGGDDARRDRRLSQHLSRVGVAAVRDSGSPCPGRGCAGSRGSSTTLANRSRQVSSRLSQPARTTKSSPAAIGRTGASSSASRRAPPTTSWLATSATRPAFAPLVQVSRPRVNQPAAKPPSPEAVKLRSPVSAVTEPVALVRRIVEVDAAAGVAELGVAGVLEGAPDGLVQHVRERAHLGDEGEPAAADLADGAAAHQHALADGAPVHPPDLDLGVVPAAVEDVGLGDGVRGQHALGLLRVDREVGAAPDLRGGEAGLGLVGRRRRTSSGRSWSVKPKTTPSARSMRQHQASVVVPLSRCACRAADSVFIASRRCGGRAPAGRAGR